LISRIPRCSTVQSRSSTIRTNRLRVPGEEVAQGCRPDQGFIPDEDQGRALIAFKRLTAGAHGVPGAELLFLGGEVDVGLVGQRLADLFRAVADDHDDLADPRAARGVDDVTDHRLAANLVEHLGALRLHPLAVPSRQDDRHWSPHDSRLVPVPRRVVLKPRRS
jgi:hypothetical protein